MYFQGFDPWYDHVFVKCLLSIDYTHTIPNETFWNLLLHTHDILRFNHATITYIYVYKIMRWGYGNLNHLNTTSRMKYGE